MKKVHIVGIGGIGMSGIARILLAQGWDVAGSDIRENGTVHSLRSLGAQIFIGHEEETIHQDALVVYSTAITKDHPSLIRAQKQGNTLLHRSQMVQNIIAKDKVLAVAGTHGKTTTSSLLAHVMSSAEKDPTCIIGGVVRNYGVNSWSGTGEYAVIEADESDGSFTAYTPYAAIVTNIGTGDHLSHYGTQESLENSFCQFMHAVPKENLFYCCDDDRLAASAPYGLSYGFSPTADISIARWEQDSWDLRFDLHYSGQNYTDISLPLIGRHNVLNGSAVFCLAISLGIDEAVIRDSFSSFQGIDRRCTVRLSSDNSLCIDDYAHHPTEILTTLTALRKANPDKKLIAVFQPHRYSRMAECFSFLGHAFAPADKVIVTDIYSAGEQPLPGIDEETLCAAIREYSSVDYCGRSELAQVLARHYMDGNVLLVTLGAGDCTAIADEIKTICSECYVS